MSTVKYKAFVACVECGNFTKAAEKLGYSESAISQLIRSLEDELDLTLLKRSNRKTALTPEGEILLPAIKELISNEENIKERAQKLHSLETGSVSLGCISSIAIRKLSPVIRDFKHDYPSINVSVVSSNYEDIEKKLLNNEIDMGFVSAPSLKEFSTVRYMKDKLMLVMPDTERYPRSIKDLRILNELDFILPAEGTGYDIGKLFDRYGIKPRINFEMNDDLAALEMVKQGFGVTILPELLINCLPMDGTFSVPIHDTERQICIAVRQDKAISKAAAMLLECILKDRS